MDLLKYIDSMIGLELLVSPLRPKAIGLSRTGVLPSLVIDETGASGPGGRDLYYVEAVLFHLLGQELLSCELLAISVAGIDNYFN